MINQYNINKASASATLTASESLTAMCLPYIFFTDVVLNAAAESISDDLTEPKVLEDSDHPP